MHIKITADSTCDLSPELIESLGVTITPLTIVMGGESYRDGVDITAADIFAHVSAGGQLCSTTAVNAEEYRAVFESFATRYDAVIHINIGSDFSSCHQNACIAAREFSNVFVVDSRSVSTGHGMLVLEACRRAEHCTDAAALRDELRALAERVEVSVLLDRLDYVAKGGRCSPILALGANLLKLKPCLEVINGKLEVGKKYRGKQVKCITEYVRERLENRPDIARGTLFFTSSGLVAEALEAAWQAVQSFGRFEQVYVTTAGTTISCHSGPGMFGLVFLRKE